MQRDRRREEKAVLGNASTTTNLPGAKEGKSQLLWGNDDRKGLNILRQLEYTQQNFQRQGRFVGLALDVVGE